VQECLNPDGSIKYKYYTNSLKESGREPLPFNQYFRQYYGYMKDGHLIVTVCLAHNVYTTDNPFIYSRLKYGEYGVHGGGNHYGYTIIDLTEGKVTLFRINSEI
jgi:hypothetical protein